MPERIKLLFESGAFPFILAAGNHVKMNWTRIVESLIIGAVVAFATMYTAQKVMEIELKNVKEDIKEIKEDIRSLERSK